MKRIGIAASKVARGNLLVYNLYVVLLSFLFSLFIFILAGSTIVFSLIILSYLSSEIMLFDFDKGWASILAVCMVSLSIVVFFFNLIAVSTNIKLPKSKDKILNGK